jgi:hypothetical protein
MEADHRSACRLPCGRHREARMVCFEIEDRGVPQDPQIGCKAEESKHRTAQRLTNLVSIFCILSWRVFWMMLNRSAPDAPPILAPTATEIAVLDCLVSDKP